MPLSTESPPFAGPAVEAGFFPSLIDLSAPFAPPSAEGLDDATLIETQRSLAQIKHRVDAAAAAIAYEMHRRSAPELGYDGLAQRLGARTPQRLVQQITGATAREAHTLVRTGSLMATSTQPAGPLWLRDVSAAVSAGTISLDAADAIRAGLRDPDEHVTADDLADAAAELLRRAPTTTVERLAAAARDARAQLDLEHVADAERVLRERRYLRVIPQADGMTRLTGLLDPESAAIVTAAYDAATSPRRGGPRFVDPDARAAAERLVHDSRSTEQIAVDTFVDLVRIGMTADEHAPALGTATVTLHVRQQDLECGLGVARFEGQSAPISIDTAERQLCDAGIVATLFDTDGQVVNVGREQRRFTRRQRRGLAARDGGCRFLGCDRPPSWTEAHHIEEWRHGGRTDIADGVLLCRHHHLLVHNNGWRIIRDGAEYFVVPPASYDPLQTPIPAPARGMPCRSAS